MSEKIVKVKNARNQIRTGDTQIFSQLLYQLSYPGLYTTSITNKTENCKGNKTKLSFAKKIN